MSDVWRIANKFKTFSSLLMSVSVLSNSFFYQFKQDFPQILAHSVLFRLICELEIVFGNVDRV